jgi:ribokinase
MRGYAARRRQPAVRRKSMASRRPIRTAVVGHVEWVEFARVDRIPGPGDIAHAVEWWEEPAGGGSVAAVQLHVLSGDCTFYTALARDAVGKRAVLELEGLGPRVEAAKRSGTTRRAVAQIEPSGERTITTLGERLQPSAVDPLRWDALGSVDAAYFCAGDAGALELARRARVLVATSRVADLLVEAGLRLDAVVGSGGDPSENVEPSSFGVAPRLLVRTDGARGGTFETDDGRRGHYPAIDPPGPVVDTYGGGDCFAAGLAFALGRGLEVQDALTLAARCGAWCVSGRGPYGRMLRSSDL